MRRFLHWFLIMLSLGVLAWPQPTRAQGGTFLYLPLVSRNFNPLAGQRIVNAPYVPNLIGPYTACPDAPSVPNWCIVELHKMGIFWFGKVGTTENYTDVRVAYTATELVIYTATFDRLLYYDQSPSSSDLTTWDSVTVYLDRTGVINGRPTSTSYRLDAQASWFEARTNYQAAYVGDGNTWVANNGFTFTTAAGFSGSWNNGTDDKGWAMTFRIPFSSLGVSSPTAGAAIWGLSVVVHDRDDAGGTPIADKTWPETADSLTPSSWGRLAWGEQIITSTDIGSTAIIKHKGASGSDLSMIVKDAGVGGSTVCGGGFNYWTQWGNVNDKDYNGGIPAPVLNVQNQSNISDYPCFSKIYLSFPLNTIPTNKTINKAVLTMYQTGGSGPASNGQGPFDALIQVLSFGEDFTDTTITWNNAPLPLRNYRGETIQTVVGCGSSIPWPCIVRTWDVTPLITEAYQQGKPARIVLYSADSNFSTGKYFTSSNTADWNHAGRPTLTVRYNP